jgi:ribosome-associated protein
MSSWVNVGEVFLETVELARLVVDLIADRKGEDIVLMDLHRVTLIADYFVIGSANSDRQINAITDHIREEVKKQGQLLPLRTEGRGENGWVLMDYGGVIVHIFSPQTRSYYDLEELWREANVLVRMQ